MTLVVPSPITCARGGSIAKGFYIRKQMMYEEFGLFWTILKGKTV